MILEIHLPEFGVFHDQQFAALISDCVVTDLRLIPSNPPGIEITYQIKENPDRVSIPIPNVAYEPEAC